ncbi:MAG TPA: hypothetical protein VD839_05185 [Burkholderiales bacterium]|nr:hypothetical protein [Burkholderiales bacterium]
MDPSWKHRNLGGGGLQSANIRLARLLKRRHIAYALLMLFPVGAHRLYLEDRRGALLYCLGSAAVAVSLVAGAAPVGWALAALLTGAALLDIRWIEKTLVRINKRLRMEVYMSQTAGAPAGYRGRFVDDSTRGAEAAREERAPSFAEQEHRLRDSADNQERSGQ